MQRLLAELPTGVEMLCVHEVVPCLLQCLIGRAFEQDHLVPELLAACRSLFSTMWKQRKY